MFFIAQMRTVSDLAIISKPQLMRLVITLVSSCGATILISCLKSKNGEIMSHV